MAVTVKKQESVEITPIKTKKLTINIVGTSPMIMHRFAFKAWQELLLPSQKKNQAAKAESLKHDPLNEFRECLYRNRDDDAPSLFHVPTAMLQEAIASAALDMPGATKSSVSRWVSVVGSEADATNICLYGTPELYTTMVRSSDMNRTPDVRTRPIFRQWAISGVTIEYKIDPLSDSSVLNLLAAAGVIVGCGDWRPQKGGSMGKFRICDDDDAEFKQIVEHQGRDPQLLAFEAPGYYDSDTADINQWFAEEIARREKILPSASKPVLKTVGG
jgi:hypothetical protein